MRPNQNVVAQEMVSLSKNQFLLQAGTAMFGQRTLLKTTDGLINMAKEIATRSELRRADRPLHTAVEAAGPADSTLDGLH